MGHRRGFPMARLLMYLIVMMVEEKARYEIRPSSESTLALEVFKKGLLAGKRHILFFERYAGELHYDQENPESSNMRLVVESRSIACSDKWLKPKQRKKVISFALSEMLAADRFPEIVFASTRITKKLSNLYELQGDLAMRGTVRPVSIHLAAKRIGAERLELDGEATIRMKDYGMEPPSAVLGLAGTKNKMGLRFLLWAEQVKADGVAQGGA